MAPSIHGPWPTICRPGAADGARTPTRLAASPQRLLHDLEWLGLLFESLVVRDLRVLAQALDGEVFHDRDNDGLEVDASVQLRHGRWGAIDIKLGAAQVDAAAASAWCRCEAWSSELKPHGCSS